MAKCPSQLWRGPLCLWSLFQIVSFGNIHSTLLSCWHAWIWFWLSKAWALPWVCLRCQPGLEYVWGEWIPFSHWITPWDPESISFGNVDYWLIYFSMISMSCIWTCQKCWRIWDFTLFKCQWVIFVDAGGRQRLLGQSQRTLVFEA